MSDTSNYIYREEMQFAVSQFDDDKFILWSVDEACAFQQTDMKNIPQYAPIQPEDNAKYHLVYGSLIPNPLYDKDNLDFTKFVEKYQAYAFATLFEDNVYISGYSGIKLLNQKIYCNYIPFAALLQTSLNLNYRLDYGFGYPLFLYTPDVDIFTNIINRQCVLCIRDIEKSFTEYTEDWEKYINEEHCLATAKELF